MLAKAVLLTIKREVRARHQGLTVPPHCYDYVLSSKIAKPLLLIYSEKDVCIPAQDVEAIADAWEKAGLFITKVCFTDSDHVNHLQTYEKEYSDEVAKFVAVCLQGLESD